MLAHTSSFHPPLSLNHRLFLHIPSIFSTMGKINVERTMSSRAETVPGDGNSAVHQNHIMADGPLSDNYDDHEDYVIVGSHVVPLHKNTKDSSLPLLIKCNSSAERHPELMSMSDQLPSPATTTGSENIKFKRTRVDLGLDNCSESSVCSSFENRLAKQMSRSNCTSHNDECSQPSHFWREKSASAIRPYNRYRKFNYAEADHNIDSSFSVPKFKPYDICFRGKRNSDIIRSPLKVENKETCIEIPEGGSKEGILMPGMVLLKHYLNHNKQVSVVKICRELGLGPGGFYQPGYADGAKLRLKIMCLGMDWDPQTRKYGYKREIDGSTPPRIPPFFSKLVIRAIQEAHHLINKEYETNNVEDILPSMTPDICIVNFYSNNGRLGLHQDRDESRESLRKGLPVVSFSFGDSAKFLYGKQRDVDKAESILLESGDVLIFGGESRHVFHGVPSIIPESAPKELLQDTLLSPGRLNLTFRQY